MRRTDPTLLDFPRDLLLPATEVGEVLPQSYTSGERGGTSVGERLDEGVSPADLVASARQREALGFPDRWKAPGVSFPLSYEFDPTSPRDGVSIQVPVETLSGLDAHALAWLVPGMWDDLVAGLIKALPKRVRRQLVPAPDVAAEVTAWIRERLQNPDAGQERQGPSVAEKKQQALDASLSRLAQWAGVAAPPPSPTPTRPQKPEVSARWDARWTAPDASLEAMVRQAVDATRSVEIDADAWRYAWRNLPAHLRMTVIAVDARGRELGHDKDARALAARLRSAERSAVRQAVAAAKKAPPTQPRTQPRTLDRTDVHEWAGLSLPETVRALGPAGVAIDVTPALVAPGVATDPADPAWPDAGWSGPFRTDIVTGETPARARRLHRDGVGALVLAAVALPTARVTTRWRGEEAALLATSPYASTEALVADAQWAAARRLMYRWEAQGSDAWTLRTQDALTDYAAWVRELLEDEVYAVVREAAATLRVHRDWRRALEAAPPMRILDVVTEERAHVDGLLTPGFISRWAAIPGANLTRWIQASTWRIERADQNPGRDKGVAWQAREATALVAEALDRARRRPWQADLGETAWRLVIAEQDLRVSLFAQHLRTSRTISPARLTRLAETL